MNVSEIRSTAAARPAESAADAKLRKVAQQLEGAFVEQLFKAMRDTVPEGGLTHGGGGEEMFSSMMDQHLAAEVPSGWRNGIGEALVRQLRGAMEAADAAPAAAGEE